jgi:hypothetical protein
MRIEDNPKTYEYVLERCLKIEGNVLNLLEHKVLHGRFIGIYRFEKNYGLLHDYVQNNKLSNFTIYSYMESLVELTSNVLKGRDRKNKYLIVNLNPRNLLLLSSEINKFKLIRVLPHSKEDLFFVSVPELEAKNKFIDNRSHMKYILGKLFFFLCFKKLPKKKPNKFHDRHIRRFLKRKNQ